MRAAEVSAAPASRPAHGIRMRRVLIALVTAAALLAVAAPAAPAATVTIERSQHEIDQSRVVLGQSLAALKAGDREKAYHLSRAAYLNHFEFVEIPLRLRNPNLVIDTEFKYAKLRNDIQDGAPVSKIRSDTAVVRAALVDVDRELARKGVAAPLVAFGFSFSILFREGVEAVLLIAILLGSLAAGSASNYKRPLALGVGAAVVATAALFLLTTLVIDVAPLSRELLEAVTALFAVVVLVAVSFWLVARLEHRRRMEFMRARVAAAMAAGTTAAFAGLGFTAVFREGFETVLFYQALALFAEGLILWVVLGAVAAAIALGGVGYAILKLGKQLPLRPMLIAGAGALLLLSVAFIGNAVFSLQEADYLAVAPVAHPRLPVFLAELTGIHPTTQGLVIQAVVLGIYILGAVYVFAWQPSRRRRRVAETAAA
jgi:high-affinity iron transporter